MKFQPKRFVVEVKRGTNRASFASPDASADRFSDAEAALFGAPNRIDDRRQPSWPGEAATAGKAEAPSGRILRSLVEPPPPVVEEEPPVRRGRKPGSKNKPKPQLETAFPPALAAGRPAAGQESLAAAMRSYGFADDAAAWSTPAPAAAQDSPRAASPAPAPAQTDPAAPAASPAAPRARPGVRLRDRSSILKRYVLDIEPRPGQPGAIRARRRARAV